MKDFYDVYQILTKRNYNSEALSVATIATFKNRQTAYQPNHALFSGAIGESAVFQKAWGNFIKKTKIEAPTDFNVVSSTITNAFLELWESMKN
jgi:hypothetical protein